MVQERGYPKNHHGYDIGQGCIATIPRCPQKHSDSGFGPKETSISLPNVSGYAGDMRSTC